MKDSDVPEDMTTNLEVALLGLVRKVITVMPDNLVRRVIGQAIQHESLIAIAHNPDIVIRTAVIRVSRPQVICVTDCSETKRTQVL